MLKSLLYLNIIGWIAVGFMCGIGIGSYRIAKEEFTPSILSTLCAGVAGAILFAFLMNLLTGLHILAFSFQALFAAIAGGIGCAYAVKFLSPPNKQQVV